MPADRPKTTEDDDLDLEPVWVYVVCGWEGDPDKVGSRCPCGDRDLDAEDEEAERAKQS